MNFLLKKKNIECYVNNIFVKVMNNDIRLLLNND